MRTLWKMRLAGRPPSYAEALQRGSPRPPGMSKAARWSPRRPCPNGSEIRSGSEMLVGGGKDLGLHQLHGGAAALNPALPRLDAEHLRPTGFALESLSELVGHRRHLLTPGGPPTPSALELHRLAAADQLTVSCPGDNHLRAALGAQVPLSDLVRQGAATSTSREDRLPTGLGSRSQSSQCLPGSQALLVRAAPCAGGMTCPVGDAAEKRSPIPRAREDNWTCREAGVARYRG